VERANQRIKNILAKRVMAQRAKFPKPEDKKMILTWVTQVPTAMRTINAMRSKGANIVEPYCAVYGVNYDVS
jgi:hypothetical protein